jgi:hypothetical protein
MENNIYGYFDNHSQEIPAHDPGLSVPCPFCCRAIDEFHGYDLEAFGRIQTISFYRLGSNWSWFYRVHKDCYESATKEKIQEIESAPIDGVIV